MFNGLYYTLFIIFGTNLLTGGPAQIVVFPESKRNETFGNVIFSTNMIQETWSGHQETIEEATRQGARLPPWARPPPSWAPPGSPVVFLPLYIPIYPKTIGEQNRSGVPTPQASVATKNQSGPCSGTLPEGGEPSPVAIFIIPALSMTRRE